MAKAAAIPFEKIRARCNPQDACLDVFCYASIAT